MKVPIPVSVLVIFLLASCGPTNDESIDSPPERTGLIRAHHGQVEGGMGAIVAGILEVSDEVGCVWLTDLSGSRHPVVWPAGTTYVERPFAIVLPDGQKVSHGDEVSGGGGYVNASAATTGMEPFPDECVYDGQAAVFNANSVLQVTVGAGVEVAPTLISRFSVPESIGLELVAANPNQRSVALADLVSGTVHLYEPGDFAGPEDAIDGVSGGGGFIHVWASGNIYSYPGRLTDEPLVYRPEVAREIDGIAPSLEVLPGPDGEHTWIAQDGLGFGPTIIELVNLVEVQLDRIRTVEVPGSWQPVGATTSGLVLVSNEGSLRTRLVGIDGGLGDEVSGAAISVGWSGAAILEDGALRLVGPDLAGALQVDKPLPGSWTSVGGPSIPTDAPPIRTGGSVHVVGLTEGEGPDLITHLVVVSPDGSTRTVHQTDGSAVATFSRAEDWVAVIAADGVTLISSMGEAVPLGEIFPDGQWVLSAG